MRLFRRQSIPEAELPPVVAALDRLWQTKIHSISLIDAWSGQTRDLDLQAGWKGQLVDERRHQRLVGEEIKRLGGRVSSERRESAIGRAFAIARAQERDLLRLFAFYRGIKAVTLSRCGYLGQLVEPEVAILLHQIARDEERHLRWADIRLERSLTAADVRECNLLATRVNRLLEGAWQKASLDLVRGQGQRIS